mgnify:CR=1 FL=1
MRFYINALDPDKHTKDFNDLTKAVDMRAIELGIKKSTVNLARAVMGYRKANLAVVIIDQNTKHPKTPVKNAGALLIEVTTDMQKFSLRGQRDGWPFDERLF